MVEMKTIEGESMIDLSDKMSGGRMTFSSGFWTFHDENREKICGVPNFTSNDKSKFIILLFIINFG